MTRVAMTGAAQAQRFLWITLLIVGMTFLFWSDAGRAQQTSPFLDNSLNEQVVMITVGSGALTTQLQTTIYKPPGNGPFPLLLANHGKALGDPHRQGRERFIALAREFVERGYAVIVPMRTGFAGSGGTYADRGCNVNGTGEEQADQLGEILDYAVKQTWVDPNRIVIAGQSAGGLATMAFGSRHYPGVKGLINYSGGLRVNGGLCIWKPILITAFGEYGAGNNTPSLWFYGANDSLFDPVLVRLMYAAYTSAGGNAKLIAYGPFKNDSHGMVGSIDGLPIWVPETEAFLQRIGMPSAKVFTPPTIQLPPSNFAQIGDVNAVPYMDEKGREGYQKFLAKPLPRAFAIAPGGIWQSLTTDDGEDVPAVTLALCKRANKLPCTLYAIDNNVVWTGTTAAAATAATNVGNATAAVRN